MHTKLLKLLLALLSLSICGRALGQNVGLAALKPIRVFTYFPNEDATPQIVSLAVPGREGAESLLAFKADSEVTYAVPPNQTSLAGILVYHPPQLALPEGEPPYYTPVLVEIVADGKTILSQGLNETTPPLQFSLPLAGVSEITILSKTAYVGYQFYLADAHFSAAKVSATQFFLPLPQHGYVDCAPLPRQRIYGIFQPGESVPVDAYYGGGAVPAAVSLRFIPEQSGVAASAIDLSIPLASRGGALSQGTAQWKVPLSLGPGKLTIEETVAGQKVFVQELRIAIEPILDLSNVVDSSFGIHTSTSSYPLVYDEFAGLWGAKWGRIFLHWSLIEPQKGEFNYAQVDTLVNLYQMQHMKLLVAIGEDTPAWAGNPGPDYEAAWRDYVFHVVQHLAGNVSAWDIFNEVDVKYVGLLAKTAPVDWDVKILKSAIQAVHAADPHSTVVCCSTGSTQWLIYDKKLLDAGVLSMVDVISLHPYQPAAPEIKDGPFNYRERIDAIDALARSYNLHKPIWSTEANWIIKPPSAEDPRVLKLTEQEQAEYVVRVNLLSAAMGVKYFVHAPFGHRLRPEPHLSTWAAYAQMASLFSESGTPALVLNGPQVFAVAASTRSGGHVEAVWSVGKDAEIAVSSHTDMLTDMYGNGVSWNPMSVHISQAPMYFKGAGPAPSLRVLRQVTAPAWRTFAPVGNWTCTRGTSCTTVTGGLRVQSLPAKYGYQLTSPVMEVPPDSCQIVHFEMMLEKGSAAVFALDSVTGKMVDRVVYASWVPDNKPRMMDVRFHTGSSTRSIKLVLADSNFAEQVSAFTIFNRPQLAACP